MNINGKPISRDMEARTLLVHYIREDADLRGTHWGCDTSNCGACVVWMDGTPVKSCTVLAASAAGHDITTVEGLEKDGSLDPIQQGFIECHGLQCGFCTPGMWRPASSWTPPPGARLWRKPACRICNYLNHWAVLNAWTSRGTP